MDEEIITITEEENKKDLIDEVDSNTLIDRFKKLDVRVSVFLTVSKDVYDLFCSKIRAIKDMYEREAKEYKEAYRTNKLTLSCNPEVNMNIRHAVSVLEEEVDEFEIEYAYLSLKQRLESFISNLNTLYIQIIKRKKKDKLLVLLEKAEEKFEEISESGINSKISENMEIKKEEIVSLLYIAKYLIGKCKLRLEVENFMSNKELLSDSEVTEYYKAAVEDLKRLDEIASADLEYHPLKMRVTERIEYIKKFGFKEAGGNFLKDEFFTRLFYAEDALIPRSSDDVKVALKLVSCLNFLSENEKQFIKLMIFAYKNKVSTTDVAIMIKMFSDDIDIITKVPEEISNFISDEISSDESIRNYVRGMSKGFSKLMTKNLVDAQNKSGKFIYVFTMEADDKKSIKRALDGKVEYKIKDECDLYISADAMSKLSFF